MLNVTAFNAVGRGFSPRPRHTKASGHQKMAQTAYLLSKSLTVLQNRVKGLEVCGTANAEMHYSFTEGSIARVRYCIPVPDFYPVLYGLRCRKKNSYGLINLSDGEINYPNDKGRIDCS